jgi:hypothetical protein
LKIALAFPGDVSKAEKYHGVWTTHVRTQSLADRASRKSSTREPEDASAEKDVEMEMVEQGAVEQGPSASSNPRKRKASAKVRAPLVVVWLILMT